MASRLDTVSRELFRRLSEREGTAIDALSASYEGALERTILDAVSGLPRDEAGRLIPDSAALLRLRNQFGRFGDGEGASTLLELHVEQVRFALLGHLDVISDGWQRLGEDALSDDSLALSTLMRANWLDKSAELGRYHHMQLRDAVTRHALGRSDEASLRAEMRRLSDRSANEADRMHHDAVIGYSRAVIDESSKERGYEYFQYVGPDDSANRKFCDTHTGKVYTREEIERLDNGQTSNVMLTAGGYRCRHHLRPVKPEWFGDDEWAAMSRKDFAGGAQGTGSDPSKVYDKWLPTDRMVNQEGDYTCGAAVARQVMLDDGRDVPESKIFEGASGKITDEYGVDHPAMSLRNIKTALVMHGGYMRHQVAAGGLPERVSEEGFTQVIRDHKHVIAAQGAHYVIVDEISAGVVKLRDPWGEKGPGSGQGLEAEIPYDDFMVSFRAGTAVVVVVKE